jgi:hypothetical protein
MREKPTGTGADFDGQHVGVAFNLNRCGPKKAVKSPQCFTVFGGQDGRLVAGYVDAILLEDVRFVVSDAGLRRIRKTKQRAVVAWVEGTARDPDKVKRRLGDMRSWVGFTFCPYTDDDFVVPQGKQERCAPGANRPGAPIVEAKWVYFDSLSKKAIALPRGGYSRNVAARARMNTEVDLSVLAGMIGGDVTSMTG